MSDEKWTPGPWEVCEVSDKEDQVVGFDFYLRSKSMGAVGYWTGGKQNHKDEKWLLSESDANLISAAPELYEALDRANKAVQKLAEDYGAIPDYLDELCLDAILAKARGE